QRASEATMCEKREWPCSKILVLTSPHVHDITMRARSPPDDAAQQSARQVWAASSAIRPETDAATPSASEASRTKARTSSARAGSSTSCSSESCGGMGTLTADLFLRARSLVTEGPERVIPGRVRSVRSMATSTSATLSIPSNLHTRAGRKTNVRFGLKADILQ